MGSSTARKSPPKRAEFIRQGAGTESASAATLVRDYGKAEARSSRSSTRRPTGRHGAAPIRGSASRAISRAGSGFIRGRAPAPFAERYYGTWGSGAAWRQASAARARAVSPAQAVAAWRAVAEPYRPDGDIYTNRHADRAASVGLTYRSDAIASLRRARSSRDAS